MIDPREPQVAPLQDLPWELMRQPGTPEFLALSRRRLFERLTEVSISVNIGGFSHWQAIKPQELFAHRVIPQFRLDIGEMIGVGRGLVDA